MIERRGRGERPHAGRIDREGPEGSRLTVGNKCRRPGRDQRAAGMLGRVRFGHHGGLPRPDHRYLFDRGNLEADRIEGEGGLAGLQRCAAGLGGDEGLIFGHVRVEGGHERRVGELCRAQVDIEPVDVGSRGRRPELNRAGAAVIYIVRSVRRQVVAILPRSVDQRVRTGSAEQPIGAQSAVERVAARPAVEKVAAGTAAKRVVA